MLTTKINSFLASNYILTMNIPPSDPVVNTSTLPAVYSYLPTQNSTDLINSNFWSPYLLFDNSGSGSGMFSTFMSTLGLLDEYETHPNEYTGLEVNFGQSGLYYDTTLGNNWFEYYFDPIQIGEKKEPIDTINKDKRRTLFYSVEGNYKKSNEGMPREIGHSYFTKYFHLKPAILKKINKFASEHFQGKYIVSIHYRGTDKVDGSRSEAKRLSYQDMTGNILTATNERNLTNFVLFIATDEESFITYTKQKFPGRVITSDVARSTDGKPLHIGSKNPYQSGEDALIDCMLLAKGNLLIRTSSNLSLFVKYINPNIPIIEVSQRSTPSTLPSFTPVENKDTDFCATNSYRSLVCKGNLGIPRKQMPQLVSSSIMTNYVNAKKMEGIDVSQETIPSKLLFPTQNELNSKKVYGLVSGHFSKDSTPCELPILVSSGNADGALYVVDGHHRYAACRIAYNAVINAFIVDSPIHIILEELRSFPGVEYHEFSQF